MRYGKLADGVVLTLILVVTLAPGFALAREGESETQVAAIPLPSLRTHRAPGKVAPHAGSPPGSYEALVGAFCEGRVEEVLAATDDAANDYRLSRLRARAAWAAFERRAGQLYRQKGVDAPPLKVSLRPLAEACTAAYEVALRCAPSDYERACVAAEWMAHRTATHCFDADSELLRSVLPAARPELSPEDEARLDRAAERMADIVLATLGNAPKEARLPANRVARIAALFSSQFRQFARINPPDQVIDAVLEDLPVFLTTAVPQGVIERPEKSADTARWHLWVAFTQDPPHPVERAFIDRQIGEYADYVEKTINSLSEGRDLPPLGTSYAERFRKRYRLLGDNRLVPYFKQAYLPYEWARVEKRNKDDTEEYAELLRHGLRRYPARPTRGSRRRRIDAVHELNAGHVMRCLLHAILGYQPTPALLRTLPDGVVTGYGQGQNRQGYWHFRVNKFHPFPDLGDTRFIYWVDPPEGE